MSFLRLKGKRVVEMGFFWIVSVKLALSEWRKRSGICPVVLIVVAVLVKWAVTGEN